MFSLDLYASKTCLKITSIQPFSFKNMLKLILSYFKRPNNYLVKTSTNRVKIKFTLQLVKVV